eukprot:4490840-Prymnesium_polylepis.1
MRAMLAARVRREGGVRGGTTDGGRVRAAHLQWPADLARRRPRGRVQQRERLLAVVGRQSARAAGGGREGAEAGARAQFHDASAAKCRERRELTRDDLCGRPEHDAVCARARARARARVSEQKE